MNHFNRWPFCKFVQEYVPSDMTKDKNITTKINQVLNYIIPRFAGIVNKV